MEEVNQRTDTVGQLVCPRCGEAFDAKEKKCPHCGMKNDLTLCRACGATMAKSAKSCPKCGAKNKKPFYKRFSFWFIVIIVLLMVSCSAPKSVSSKPAASNSEAANSSENSAASEATLQEQPAEVEPETSMGEKNALRAAKQYLGTMPFSYSGLIKQLEFEGYSTEDATYAADNCDADWNEQAAKAAKNYLDTMAFSRDSLIKQLEFDGYTEDQATYGAEQNGY